MTPARLHRKEEKTSVSQLILDTIEEWVLTHSLLCLTVAICLLMALFIFLIFTLVGVSVNESGTLYNQFQNIV
jgi:hypothetical protein